MPKILFYILSQLIQNHFLADFWILLTRNLYVRFFSKLTNSLVMGGKEFIGKKVIIDLYGFFLQKVLIIFQICMMAKADSQVLSNSRQFFQNLRLYNLGSKPSALLVLAQTILSCIIFISYFLSLPALNFGFKTNLLLFTCYFLLMFCLSGDIQKILQILHFIRSLSLQAYLLTRCRTLKRPKNLALIFQFHFVIIYLLFDQIFLSDTQFQGFILLFQIHF